MDDRPAAGPEGPPAEGGDPARRFRILVPIDFSPASRRAVTYALRERDREEAEIYLFHVFEPGRRRFVGKRLAERLDSELERMERLAVESLRGLVGDGAPPDHIHCRVGSGRAWEQILRMASNIDADLVVLGAHGREDERQAPLGSQAEKVVRRAPCTVICVRAKDPYFVVR